MRVPALGLALFSVFVGMAATVSASDTTDYFDESTHRHLTLGKGEFGTTRVTVRFAGDPGSAGQWIGQGSRKDKDLTFARIVGEGEDPGTSFNAKISESKVDIAFKPDQKAPQDAGINGSYRRVSESKLLQLVKKEFQAADDRLQASLKAATKTWDRRDRAALDLWKNHWPAVRQRWINLGIPKTTPSNPTAEKAAAADKTAKDWLQVAQATARGYYFIETLPDPKTGVDWDGEYDDLGGGHASLRLGKDGKLRISLANSRLEGDEAATIEATATPEQISKGKNGELVAAFDLKDPELKEPNKPLQVRLTKIGRYLHIETENAARYSGRGWFDGIYRGSPVPAQ